MTTTKPRPHKKATTTNDDDDDDDDEGSVDNRAMMTIVLYQQQQHIHGPKDGSHAQGKGRTEGGKHWATNYPIGPQQEQQ